METVSELLENIDNSKIETSSVLEKLITFYQLNKIDIPELVSWEYEGYATVKDDLVPDYRKMPYTNITYDSITRFEKWNNLPLVDLFGGQSNAFEFLKTFSFVIPHPLSDLENWINQNGGQLDLTHLMRNFISSLEKTFPNANQHSLPTITFSLHLAKPHLESMVSKIRKNIKKEILAIAIKYNISINRPILFDKDILDLIRDDRVLSSLKEAWKCYSHECYTAGSIMLRKALETAIHVGITSKNGNDNILKDNKGNYHGLKKKIEIIRGNGLASGSIVDELTSTTKIISDIAAHNYYVKIRKNDFDKANNVLRMFFEDFYHRLAI